MPDQDEGRRGVSNPIQLQKYLSGIDYPANKDTLVARAQEEGADERVMETLRNLPMDQFNSPNDVSEVLREDELAALTRRNPTRPAAPYA